MIGQFHDRCDERAAHNPDFRVSHSPVPLAAIRRMAVHDVLFLRERREWFEGYVARFGRRYRTDTQGLDAQYVSLYHQARARFGMIAPGAEPAPGHRLDRAELDRQFSPSRLVPDLAPYLQEYARLSAAARQAHRMRTLNYGDQPEEVLDFFAADPPAAGPPKDSQPADGRPADGPGRVPVQVFVHGGNWQALSQADSGFPAPAFLAAGSAFAAVNYGLAPGHSLDQMVAMVRRAVRWLYTHAGELGIDPERIHLSGSSAGAHLVAMALVDDPDAAEGGVANLVAGAALLSGIYDLEPVRHSYVNDALRLDQAAARRNSPLRHRLNTRTGAPLVIARGGIETDEYIRQHTAMVAAMRRRMPVVDIVRAERDHFDLPYELADPGTELGAAVLRQMGLLTPVVRA
jgi:arylformamidase